MLKKASLAAGFLLAAQPVFSQDAAPSTPPDALPNLSKFISLPKGPHGHWTIHGKSEVTIRCVKGEKTAEGKASAPVLSLNAGKLSIVGLGIQLDIPPEMLNIPKSDTVPANISLSLDAVNYCERNGTVKDGGGQKLVEDIITQTARQLKVPRHDLVSLLATLAQ